MADGWDGITSAGLLMYPKRQGKLKVFLVHPGGLCCRKRDEGWWSVPKGVVEEGEEPLERALKEFEEEARPERNDRVETH